MKSIATDVLIVGGGPTGLTAAMLLARMGLDAVVVERRPGPQRAPAAHVINARTFEVWRQAGLDMPALLALAKDPRDAGMVHWVTRLGGEVLGSLPYERQGDEVLAWTPTPLRNLSQHRLEPLLVAEVERITGRAPLFQHRWESSRQDGEGVTSRVVDLRSGEELEVRSRYLVGADGAGSPVRKSLGIECLGPDRIQAFVMIHFEADLRALVGAHPGVLYWVSDPGCSGVFVAHDIDREWVFMHSFDPDSEPASSFDEERCLGIVRGAMVAEAPMRILNISPWVMTSQVADRYRSGRLFLAGDAAHRFPPTGGMGLNTGVQDAHNLVWKIAAVEKGLAAPALLDTYEIERKPVAAVNAEQSLANAMKMMEVPLAMGTADEPAAARASFDAMLASSSRRGEVAAAIANQAEHFDMLGLQLGFRYQEGAIVGDGSEPEAVANPVRDYEPSSRPGAHLPHGWVARGEARVSTQDLVAMDGLTLFAPAGSPWIEAARASGIHVVEWGRDVKDTGDWWSTTAKVDKDGALLLRPDQHVAARFGACDGREAGLLARAVARVLGHDAAEAGA